MSTQHTPGPLTWRMGAHIPEVKGPLGIGVCYCPVAIIAENKESYQIRMDEATANARLFAAAPELLEALETFSKGLEGSLEGVGGGTCVSPSFTVQHFKNARAAIAKAKSSQ